ncbi:APC family permease [Streptomyces clavuligerus]|uniref:Amino acid transporter n=1 Tax=Streptomyces clavuligerus TaxID=1901 RepID=B5GQF7_STRCL|nr:APC family permease [Streptomyces clavuligerus]ANW20300.1 amino acid permease [Streptomyces clavuligerus]AXU14926.1 APC family permease [Streptomyces clavuligerus]EDY48553.1 amino acid transporter [Streptomyces clavuligerus]EFG06761.1 Amino acid transporter [Streptomyces clavuligerus]MBY6304972.1 APC family permease [Streptomyces clavuligerus]
MTTLSTPPGAPGTPGARGGGRRGAQGLPRSRPLRAEGASPSRSGPPDRAPVPPVPPGERHRLTSLQGLAALSLDAMASVAYGPEAIVLVLAAAGGAGLGWTLPVTLAIAVLLAVLVASYRQVIAAFPGGGGAYAVARTHLGRRTGLVAAASLVLDYVLNVAVSVTAGVAALTSAFPSLYDDRLWLCLGVLLLVTGVNLRGIVDSAKAFILPTAVFVGSILTLVAVGLLRDGPVSTETAAGHAAVLGGDATTVGALLLLKAFASGCSALTGVEAVANAVPSFRAPAVRRAQRTEVALGALLGVMLIGLSILIARFQIQPVAGVTVLAQLADASLGHNWGFYVVQFATVVLLALAANTSFGALPVLMSLLARDNFLPHVFRLKADREVHRHGVLALAAVALLLLLFSGGDTNTLVPLFAIGVFVGFTVCQAGMVIHWRTHRTPGWRPRALLNGLGALLTGVSAVVVTATKFTEGAWLVVVALPALVLLFERVHRAYGRIDERIALGRVPKAPRRDRSLVIVPVSHLSRLTSEALNAAVSLGDEVRAVTVTHQQDQEDREASQALRRDWERWNPGVELVELHSEHRTIGRPVSEYVRRIYKYHPNTRVTVLIPEVEPERLWQRLLQNQRGAVLAHAVRRDTEAVICRLRFRLGVGDGAGSGAGNGAGNGPGGGSGAGAARRDRRS